MIRITQIEQARQDRLFPQQLSLVLLVAEQPQHIDKLTEIATDIEKAILNGADIDSIADLNRVPRDLVGAYSNQFEKYWDRLRHWEKLEI